MVKAFSERFKDYLSSGWEFETREYLQKQRYYLVNIVIALGIIAVGQGLVYDFMMDDMVMFLIDLCMILFFLVCSLLLRRDKRYYDITTTLNALISMLYLDLLMISYPVENLEFIWLFFFVVTYMFLKGPKVGMGWNIMLFASLFLLKVQPFVQIDYSYSQISYLVFALTIIMTITYFFLHVIDENYQIILKQGEQLQDFNEILEEKVREKTEALQQLNASLAETVAKKVAVVHEQQEMLISQSRLAAMGEMLSMIAHQWRQPLATTTLRISNMQITSMLENKKCDERDDLLASVSDTLVYLSDTIDDFQTYFKPDERREEADLSELIERAAHFVNARTEMHTIEVIYEGLHKVILETLPNELIQVVINILNNAIDVIVSSGHREKKIEILLEENHSVVRIKVSDSGDGIDTALITRIFEPYFSTKSKNGTGLGLYMAKMIIEEHMAGKIYVENSSLGGAMFIIELPRTDAKASEAKEVA